MRQKRDQRISEKIESIDFIRFKQGITEKEDFNFFFGEVNRL
jgi:hypothetical protein